MLAGGARARCHPCPFYHVTLRPSIHSGALAERHNGPIPSYPVIPPQSTSVLWVRNTVAMAPRQRALRATAVV
jgi:hypothetical protein